MNTQWSGWLTGLSLTVFTMLPQADDIDIYANPGSGAPGTACSVSAGRSLVAPSYAVNDHGAPGQPEDIFFPLFKPGAGSAWPGNVKKLKLVEMTNTNPGTAVVSTRTIIAQAPLTVPPVPALVGKDSAFRSDALTFWTDPTGADVLNFNPLLDEVSGRDGRSAARGGAGQRVPGYLAGVARAANSDPGARQLYTLDPAAPGRLLPLDANTPLPALAAYLDPTGKKTVQQEQSLIAWIRGQDAYDEDGDGDVLEPRPWLLGAVLHSRPLVVNYGARPGTFHTRQHPDIRLFYGDNSGVFHSIRNTGGANAVRPEQESGAETWAFIPPSLLTLQSRLAANKPVTALRHEYGMDGEAVSLVVDHNRDGTIDPVAGDSVWVYIGQRRGGQNLFAFDMTDPDDPQFKWQINNQVPGFERLALTFSTPRTAVLDLLGTGPTRVLLFGGGYNGGWNGAVRLGKDAGAATDSIGNALYVINADSGELLWQAAGPGGLKPMPQNGAPVLNVPLLRDSVPSALSVVDADNNGTADRAYVGDSGGNVWRVDLVGGAPGSAATDPANWSVSMLARLGGSGIDDRRFFHAPDFVRSRDQLGNYDGIVLASGNRAAPASHSVADYLFLLKDRYTVSGASITRSPVALSLGDLPDITRACDGHDELVCAAVDLQQGWKLALEAPGEKGLSSPLVSNGRIVFTSYLPAPKAQAVSCADRLGSGRAYAVKLGNGAPGFDWVGVLTALGNRSRYTGLGAGIPGDVVPYRDELLLPGPGIDNSPLLTLPGPIRWRAYWREEDVDFF